MTGPIDEQVSAFYAAVGRQVKASRTAANLTQLDLSKKTGLTRSSIANLEAGRQRVQAHVLAVIAATLRIEAGDLFPDTFAAGIADNLSIPVNEDLERMSSTARSFVEAGLRITRSGNEKLT